MGLADGLETLDSFVRREYSDRVRVVAAKGQSSFQQMMQASYASKSVPSVEDIVAEIRRAEVEDGLKIR